MPKTRLARTALFALVACLASTHLLAQRQLSWDALDVTARLDADGVLDVTEIQTMVFSGDWNGGERTFNLRPRQRLELVGMDRIDAVSGERASLRADRSLDDIDDYAMTDARTLRWRSRRPSDPPFSNTRVTYAIHYRLSGMLQKDGERYVLDHDFAFPDRSGDIERLTVRLTVDSVWRPLSEIRESYSAGPLSPGRSFVLTVPLSYTGTGTPLANDGRRSAEVVRAVQAIVALLVISIGWLIVRERRLGRFVPVSADAVNADWIRERILVHPPEVVGAAWDADVGREEVVALMARMASEGTIASEVGTAGKNDSLRLELKVDRSQFTGYERALVDGLFFNGRTRTSTEELQAHYKSRGFDPAQAIAVGLNERVKAILPPGDNPRVWPWPSVVLFLVGVGCLIREGISRDEVGAGPIVVGVVSIIAAAIGQVPGSVFRKRVDWGYRALAISLVVPVAVAAAAVWWLWNQVGTGAIEWSAWMIGAFTALTLWVVQASVNALKSRQHGDAIAFRKTLATAKAYFEQELTKDRPALSDSWYPWMAAFGLAKQADRWSVQHERHRDPDRRATNTSGQSSSATSASEPSFTGFGGGRSGGAGAGAGWAAAAAGMAAGVAAPSSSGSSSSGGGSSSGGSSGGGGGGGW